MPDITVRSQQSPVKVFIEKHAWAKMHGWCKAAQSEVSGWGVVYKDEDGNFVVYDVFLPKQQCSSGYTDIDDDAAARLRFKKYRGGKGIPMDHWRFWWHTHYNFGTFWSGTDNNTVRTLLTKNGTAKAQEFLISLVINQAGHWLCRADYLYPTHMTVDQIQVWLLPNSKKQKRKRNFKSDIKRWVRPLGADDKRGEEEVSVPSYTRVYDKSMPQGTFKYDHLSTLSYRQQIDAWMRGSSPAKGSEDASQVNFMREDYSTEKKSEGVVSFGSGAMVLHQKTGKLISFDCFQKLKLCHCGDNTCKECLDMIEQDRKDYIAKKNANLNAIAEKKDEAKPEENKEQLPLLPDVAEDKKPDCPCPHVGYWEECECSKECDSCLIRLGNCFY